jgi:hypothetical protein
MCLITSMARGTEVLSIALLLSGIHARCIEEWEMGERSWVLLKMPQSSSFSLDIPLAKSLRKPCCQS